MVRQHALPARLREPSGASSDRRDALPRRGPVRRDPEEPGLRTHRVRDRGRRRGSAHPDLVEGVAEEAVGDPQLPVDDGGEVGLADAK